MHLRRAENSNLFPNLSDINFCPILTHLVIHFNHEQIVGGPQCNASHYMLGLNVAAAVYRPYVYINMG